MYLLSQVHRFAKKSGRSTLPGNDCNKGCKVETHAGAISSHFYTSVASALNAEFEVIARENGRQRLISRQRLSRTCTKSGHVLVDELHSIDFTGDKIASFLLTQKLEGVKRQSFFDNF
ncbi:MAG TPA: hypothetical protein VMT53_02030 [Terriglobales bacterium]|nr:hypothetical protein [Terriglobales bacterium]